MERRHATMLTAGVANDIVEATWLALVDGFRLPLVLLGDRKHQCQSRRIRRGLCEAGIRNTEFRMKRA